MPRVPLRVSQQSWAELLRVCRGLYLSGDWCPGGVEAMFAGGSRQVAVEAHVARTRRSRVLRSKSTMFRSHPSRCEPASRVRTGEVERKTARIRKNLLVAVMGCAVNGPGQARKLMWGLREAAQLLLADSRGGRRFVAGARYKAIHDAMGNRHLIAIVFKRCYSSSSCGNAIPPAQPFRVWWRCRTERKERP